MKNLLFPSKKHSFKLDWSFILLLFSIFLLLCGSNPPKAWSQEPSNESSFKFTSYFRSGTGANGQGGKQMCIRNSGSLTNEFRLGNECSPYGEFSLTKSFIPSSKGASDPYMKAILTLAYSPRGDVGYEETSPSVSQLYVEGGNFDESHLSYWAGKRFFRWDDIHMNDWFPINMSGVGGGVVLTSSSLGDYSFSFISNAEAVSSDSTTSIITSNIGKPTKTSFHLRWDHWKASPYLNLSFWLAIASTPPSTLTKPSSSLNSNTPETIITKSNQGTLFGVKNNLSLSDGFSEQGLIWGQGNMSNLSPYGSYIIACTDETNSGCKKESSTQMIAYLSWTQNFSPSFSSQMTLIHNVENKGTTEKYLRTWTSAGIHPIYFISDHYQLTGVLGHSVVNDDSDELGVRKLTRITFAPQVSLGKNLFARPVIRLFYTFNEWNKANKKLISDQNMGENSFLSDATQSHSVGVQTEVWF